jgi:hypothetical protein
VIQADKFLKIFDCLHFFFQLFSIAKVQLLRRKQKKISFSKSFEKEVFVELLVGQEYGFFMLIGRFGLDFRHLLVLVINLSGLFIKWWSLVHLEIETTLLILSALFFCGFIILTFVGCAFAITNPNFLRVYFALNLLFSAILKLVLLQFLVELFLNLNLLSLVRTAR